jgi:hypothetical protein
MRNPSVRQGKPTYLAESADSFTKLPAPRKVIDQETEARVDNLYQVFYRLTSLAVHGHDMMGEGVDTEAGLIEDLYAIGAICEVVGHLGLKWALGCARTDNESRHQVLGTIG